jgi:type IV pilus assembly protein PilC
MLFNYTAVNNLGSEKRGTIESVSQDAAIVALQRRGLIVVGIADAEKTSFFEKDMSFFDHVTEREKVIFSRQIATLFDAQVSALQAFSMLAAEVENKLLAKKLTVVATDIQGGMTISDALSKHPSVFSNFYVSMVRSGEEAGKLSDVFLYLADYLDRSFELSSKARSALIYPVFVVVVFIGVMILLLTMVVPKLSSIILESGKEPPFYTQIVIGVSNFLVHYGFALFFALFFAGVGIWYMERTGVTHLGDYKLKVPVFGELYKKLYLSRISDNLFTMLSSGIPVVKAVESTADVVDNKTYAKILLGSVEAIKSGSSMSQAFEGHEEIPRIMILMLHVGEETGELTSILKALSNFYRREVENTIEGVISLIEPAMIVALGLGVGFVLAAVLMPVYNIAGSM